MKSLNLVVMFIVFICIVICVYYFDNGNSEKRDNLLKNDLFLRGQVLNIKTSNNHAFGIILLVLDSCNVKRFSDTTDTFPYKVTAGKAEVYTFIPDGLSIGDEVIVASNTKSATYYYTKTKRKSKGSIKIITNDGDIDYIKKSTMLK